MKRLLPGKIELAMFLGLSLICTIVVAMSQKLDLALAALSVPVFIFAAVMGLRRNWKMAEIRQEVVRPSRRDRSRD